MSTPPQRRVSFMFKKRPIESISKQPKYEITITELNEDGDAIYEVFNGKKTKEYLGRVAKGCTMKLLDLKVYKNQFDENIIHVQILTNLHDNEVGRVCWIGLKDTDIAHCYDKKKRCIDPERRHSVTTPHHNQSNSHNGVPRVESIHSPIQQSNNMYDIKRSNENASFGSTDDSDKEDDDDLDLIVTVTNPHGDSLHGNADTYNTNDYIGPLSPNATALLMSTEVVDDEFGVKMIKVKVLTNEHGYKGHIGWVGLKDTDAAPLYNLVENVIVVPIKSPTPPAHILAQQMVPTQTVMFHETCINGDGLYAKYDGKKVSRYIGRVAHNAVLQLLDLRVYKDQYNLDIIHVKCISNGDEQEDTKVENQMGWIGLDDTSASDWFNAEKRILDYPSSTTPLWEDFGLFCSSAMCGF